MREKSFVVLWLFAKDFSAKFGGVASLGVAKAAIHGSFLRKNRIFHQLQKFSPMKVSRYRYKEDF